jgi:NAD(P)-dependent dehydrogenase (short-subunit alcohol dehydrogenase family)
MGHITKSVRGAPAVVRAALRLEQPNEVVPIVLSDASNVDLPGHFGAAVSHTANTLPYGSVVCQYVYSNGQTEIKARWGGVLHSAGMTCSYTPGDPAGASQMVAWITAKTAPLGLARGLAEVAAGTQVTVNAFIPGPAPTPESWARMGMSTTFEEFGRAYFEGAGMSSILRRFIAPDEVANLVVFLASEQASAITGATLRVDAGIIRTLP